MLIRSSVARTARACYITVLSLIPDEADDGEDKPFVYNHVGLTSEEAARLLKEHGLNQLPEKKVPKWKIFLKLLIAPMPLMIFFAAFIEWAIGRYFCNY